MSRNCERPSCPSVVPAWDPHSVCYGHRPCNRLNRCTLCIGFSSEHFDQLERSIGKGAKPKRKKGGDGKGKSGTSSGSTGKVSGKPTGRSGVPTPGSTTAADSSGSAAAGDPKAVVAGNLARLGSQANTGQVVGVGTSTVVKVPAADGLPRATGLSDGPALGQVTVSSSAGFAPVLADGNLTTGVGTTLADGALGVGFVPTPGTGGDNGTGSLGNPVSVTSSSVSVGGGPLGGFTTDVTRSVCGVTACSQAVTTTHSSVVYTGPVLGDNTVFTMTGAPIPTAGLVPTVSMGAPTLAGLAGIRTDDQLGSAATSQELTGLPRGDRLVHGVAQQGLAVIPGDDQLRPALGMQGQVGFPRGGLLAPAGGPATQEVRYPGVPSQPGQVGPAGSYAPPLRGELVNTANPGMAGILPGVVNQPTFTGPSGVRPPLFAGGGQDAATAAALSQLSHQVWQQGGER